MQVTVTNDRTSKSFRGFRGIVSHNIFSGTTIVNQVQSLSGYHANLNKLSLKKNRLLSNFL